MDDADGNDGLLGTEATLTEEALETDETDATDDLRGTEAMLTEEALETRLIEEATLLVILVLSLFRCP